MSAIAGIYSRSEAPIPLGVVDRLSWGLTVMGPDGEHRWQSPAVSMLCRPLHTEVDSGQCRPRAGGYVLAWAGRLDNRDELTARQFGSDIESIVPNVYRQLDVDGFSLLVGEFAFALWDSQQKKLILACDALGRCPLYMLSTGDYVSWASRARVLLDAWHKSPQIDDEYVADFLVNRPSARSPYGSIEQVHGGEAVVISRAGVSRKKYWSLQPNATIRYRDDAEYEERFREIFFEAVRCRIPRNRPVFCELSGGVDSSSIVCSTNDICQESSHSKTDVSTISFVFNRSKTADERAYIELVEQKIGKRGLHLSEDECPLLETLPYSLRPDWPTNALVFFSRYARTAEAMKKRGARVLLNGIGGDQLFWSEPPEVLGLPDLLVERQMKSFFTTARECARRSGWPYLKVLWRSVAPLLTATRIVDDDEQIDLGNWFLPAFVRRSGLCDACRSRGERVSIRLPSSASQFAMLRWTMRTFALEPCPTDYYVDLRYPYLDRRLVEFALAIPLSQKVRQAETRSIVRRALRGVLPEAIRVRTTKAGPDEAFHRAVSRHYDQLVSWCSDLRCASYGFVEPKLFAAALCDVRHGISTNPVQVMFTLSLELWLRSFDETGAAEPLITSPLVQPFPPGFSGSTVSGSIDLC